MDAMGKGISARPVNSEFVSIKGNFQKRRFVGWIFVRNILKKKRPKLNHHFWWKMQVMFSCILFLLPRLHKSHYPPGMPKYSRAKSHQWNHTNPTLQRKRHWYICHPPSCPENPNQPKKGGTFFFQRKQWKGRRFKDRICEIWYS